MQNQNTEQKYRADVAYIGTEYKGFQFQKNGDSVQAQLEKAFSTILRHPVIIRGASRTDSGVHAENQVVSFHTAVPYMSTDWRYSINAILPKDICVRNITVASNSFHPINDSVGKIYRYRLWRGQCTFPHIRPFVWGIHREIDLDCLLEQVSDFEGVHDFTSFCAIDSDASTKVREVVEVRIEIRDPLVDIWITGRGFLKQMVRIMVGTLVDIASGRKPKGSIPQMLEVKARDAAGMTAPSQGLSLVKVLYDDIPTLESVIREASKGYCLNI